jgi:hypothetical protein
MKIRNGFVSNSSSSSFVVAFSSEPKSAEEVREMLFGEDDFFPHPYNEGGYPAIQVAETVWKDMQNQRPNDDKGISNSMHGWLDGAPDYDDFLKPGEKKFGEINWKAYNEASCKHRQKVLKEFKDANPNTFIYSFSYADDDGSYGGALEHGGTFNKLPHIIISNH